MTNKALFIKALRHNDLRHSKRRLRPPAGYCNCPEYVYSDALAALCLLFGQFFLAAHVTSLAAALPPGIAAAARRTQKPQES